MGQLAISRAFGDRESKKSSAELERLDGDPADVIPSDDPRWLPLLIADPEIVSLDLETLIDQEPLFVLLACDGLWDVFSRQEACEFVAKELDKNGADCTAALEELTNAAVNDLGSSDNVTALMVMLKPWATRHEISV